MSLAVLAKPEELVPPERLDANGRFAWTAVIRSLDPGQMLSHADMMRLEAGCRAWSRWKALDGKLAELSAGNVLAGELSKGPAGGLQVSAIRLAADAALKEFDDFAKAFGVTMPGQRDDALSTDLFGYPDRPGRGQRGRPPFRPTPRDHNRVRLLLALGWSNTRIAAALEVSLPTLLKNFRLVLDHRAVMRDRLDARRLEVTAELAFAGNVAALKELDRLIERNDLMDLARRSSGDDPVAEDEARRPRLGKKEAAEAAAEDIAAGDSSWGDDLKPGFGGH